MDGLVRGGVPVTVGQNADSAQPGARSICHSARPLVFVLDGQRLRQLRRQHGLSQQNLADQAGISLTNVARLDASPARPAAAARSPASRPYSASTLPQPPFTRPPTNA